MYDRLKKLRFLARQRSDPIFGNASPYLVKSWFPLREHAAPKWTPEYTIGFSPRSFFPPFS
jgi:hypothetical protein